MKVLFAILVLCTLAVLGVSVAVFRLVRQHMRRHASDTTMMPAMKDAEDKQPQTEIRS